jgi:spore coat protein U-like protein
MSPARRVVVVLAGIAALVLSARLGWAACTVSATSVSFGTYNVFATTPLDSTGSVTYRCGNDRDIQVLLDRGGAGSFQRRMLKGSEALQYNLYLDPARVTIWGDGTGGTSVYVDRNPPNNRDVTVTIYGRVPAGQDVSAGSYTNLVTVTILF